MRIRSSIRALSATALLAAACVTGPAVERYGPAHRAAGLHVELRLREGRISGELLEVRDSGLVLLTEKEVVFTNFTRIRDLKADAERIFYQGGKPLPEIHERLRLLSRFPTGVPAHAMARLLEARGMQAIRNDPP